MAKLDTYINLLNNEKLYAGPPERGSDALGTHAYHYYNLYEEQDSNEEDYLSCLGISISGTLHAVWSHASTEDVDATLRGLMRVLLPYLKLPFDKEYLRMRYPNFPVITLISGGQDLSFSEENGKVLVGGLDSPKEFVKRWAMNGQMTDESVKDLILDYGRLERLTNAQGDGRFFSANLPKALFLDEGITRRAYTELEQDGYIYAGKKTISGFAAFTTLTEKGRSQSFGVSKNVPKTKELDTAEETTQLGEYISTSIIDVMGSIKDPIFDPKKLMALCRELNHNYRSNHPYASAALLRAIIDHIPPIFGFDTFSQVANSYPWGRTDKKLIQKLADYRDIADDALHRQISSIETLVKIDHLPNARAADALLTEAAKILGKRSS